MDNPKIVKKGLGRSKKPVLIARAPVPEPIAQVEEPRVEDVVVAPEPVFTIGESRAAPEPEPQVIDRPYLHAVRTTPRPNPEPEPPAEEKERIGTAETLHASGSTPDSPISSSDLIRRMEEQVISLSADKRGLFERIDRLNLEVSDLKAAADEAQRSHEIDTKIVERLEKELTRLRVENDNFRKALSGQRTPLPLSSVSQTPAVDTVVTKKKDGGNSVLLLSILGALGAVCAILYVSDVNPFATDASSGAPTTSSGVRTGTPEGITPESLTDSLGKTPPKYRGSGTPTCFVPSKSKESVPNIPIVNCEGGKAKPGVGSTRKNRCWDITACTIDYPSYPVGGG